VLCDILTLVAAALSAFLLWRIGQDVKQLRWWARAIHANLKPRPPKKSARRAAAPTSDLEEIL
jgi:hypothetical protein